MKDKPFIFNFYGTLFLLGTLSFPLQIMFLYGHQLDEFLSIFSKLTLVNFIIMGIFLINSFLSFSANKYLKSTLPISILLVAFNNWVVAAYGKDYSFSLTILATAVFALFVSGFYFTKALDVILNPDLKWWLIPKRHKKTVPVWIKMTGDQYYLEKSFDISSTGIFISEGVDKIGYTPERDYAKTVSEGDEVTLSIPLSDGSEEFQCKAEVVRKTKAQGHYPGGVGFKFLDMDLKTKLNLNRVISGQSGGLFAL